MSGAGQPALFSGVLEIDSMGPRFSVALGTDFIGEFERFHDIHSKGKGEGLYRWVEVLRLDSLLWQDSAIYEMSDCFYYS